MQCNTMKCNAIQYNTIKCNTIQYNTMQYNAIAIQCNTIQSIQYNAMHYTDNWLLKGTPSQMTTGPIHLLNVLNTQVLPVMGLSALPIARKSNLFHRFLPVPGRRHVDARASLADEFRVASDVSKPASRHLGKRNFAFDRRWLKSLARSIINLVNT